MNLSDKFMGIDFFLSPYVDRNSVLIAPSSLSNCMASDYTNGEASKMFTTRLDDEVWKIMVDDRKIKEQDAENAQKEFEDIEWTLSNTFFGMNSGSLHLSVVRDLGEDQLVITRKALESARAAHARMREDAWRPPAPWQEGVMPKRYTLEVGGYCMRVFDDYFRVEYMGKDVFTAVSVGNTGIISFKEAYDALCVEFKRRTLHTPEEFCAKVMEGKS